MADRIDADQIYESVQIEGIAVPGDSGYIEFYPDGTSSSTEINRLAGDVRNRTAELNQPERQNFNEMNARPV